MFGCRGCLLVRQSFFSNEPKSFCDVGGGVLACKGFHSSFRATQSGLSLNIGNHHEKYYNALVTLIFNALLCLFR